MLPVLCHLKPQIFINKDSAVSVLLQSLAASCGKLDSFQNAEHLRKPKSFYENMKIKIS